MPTLSLWRWPVVASLVACALLAASGCGGEKLYPVKGKVLLDGTELKAGIVTFVPDTEKGNKAKSSPQGQVGADGTYTLSTDGRSGAPAGWYKVTVSTRTPGMGGGTQVGSTPGDAALEKAPVEIHAKYTNPAETDLRVEVVPGPGPNQYDLKVAR